MQTISLTSLPKHPHLVAATEVIRILQNAGYSAFVVGSFCVSAALRKKTHEGDIDLASSATPAQVEALFAIKSRHAQQYGMLIIEHLWATFELTTFRNEQVGEKSRTIQIPTFITSFEQDSLRRDFSINALYLDLETKELYDPQSGLNDLKNKKMVSVQDLSQSVQMDALRIFRLIRFACRYQCKIDKTQLDILKKYSPLLRDISPATLKKEMERILLLPSLTLPLELLKKSGVLSVLFPEIDCLDKVPGGPKHHLEGHVWIHTKKVCAHLKKIDKNNILLLWAGLFHDVGKASTYTFDEQKCVHYYHHEQKSVELLQQHPFFSLWSKKDQETLVFLLANHLRIGQIKYMRPHKQYDLILSNHFPLLLSLYRADMLGKIPQETTSFLCLQNFAEHFLEAYEKIPLISIEELAKKYPQFSYEKLHKKAKMMHIQQRDDLGIVFEE